MRTLTACDRLDDGDHPSSLAKAPGQRRRSSSNSARRGYGLAGRRATLAAWLITGLAIAGSDSWARGDGTRETIEPVTTAAILGTIHAVIHATH